jgi:FkbM family methyltransferase
MQIGDIHTILFELASQEELYTKYYTPKVGDIVVDAGAHVGIYTRRFSESVGSSGTVIAIEPDYRAIGLLCLNTEDLHNIKILPYALWNEDSVIQFHVYTKTIGMSSCVFKYEDDKDETYPICARKLDTILDELNIKHVNFIKMDIEASELRALAGMTKTLQSVDALAIAAYHRMSPDLSSQRTFSHVADILEKADFKVRIEDGHDGEIVYATR